MLNELTSHNFYHSSGFWSDQFHEIANEIALDKIMREKDGHCCDKKVAFFLMFRR